MGDSGASGVSSIPSPLLYEVDGTWFYISIILNIVLIVVGLYFAIKVIKFMNAKIKSDQERNEKIDELIKVVSKGKSIE